MKTTTKTLPLWSSAMMIKSTAGRGAGKKLNAYGIKRLRELILELAVRGKLVDQNPSDEPASELLKKIAVEKERLIAEGVIKKQKPLPEIGEEEKPYELPEGWVVESFGNISYNRDAERIPLSVDERKGIQGKYDYYGASGVIDKIDKYIFNKPLLLIGEDGANLINRSTPIAFIAEGLYWVNNHAHVIDFYNKTLMTYVCLHINAISLVPYVTGTAQPKMNQAKMNSIPVPLPPLAEQKRIVQKVDELMALCDRLEERQSQNQATHEALVETLLGSLTQSQGPQDFSRNWQRLSQSLATIFTTEASVDQLKATILQLAVMGKLVKQEAKDEPASVLLEKIAAEKERLIAEGKIKRGKALPGITEEEKPFDLPEGWEWVRLGVISINSLGKMLDNAKNKGELKPYLRNLNVQWYQVNTDDLKKMKFEDQETEKYLVQKGDVVICEGGYPGQAAVWESETPIMFQKALHRVRFVYSCYNAKLFVHLLWLWNSNTLLSNYFTGSGIKHLTGQSLNRLPVPLPPLAEQKRIVQKVDELMALCDVLKEKIARNRETAMKLADAVGVV